MSDLMNLMEKNSNFKLSKQQQFVCMYADHFSTIELVLFGKILRYIGLKVATYKKIQLFEPAELGWEGSSIFLWSTH